MKRLLLVLFIVLLTASVFGQRRLTHFVLTVPVGVDTTYVMRAYTDVPLGLSFSYKRFDATDATLDIGERPHPDSSIFNRLYGVNLPVTLSGETQSFSLEKFTFPYLVIKLTKGNVTAGTTMDLYASCDRILPYLPGESVRLKGKASVPGTVQKSINLTESGGMIDDVTGTRITITYPHHEIHSGNHYYIEGYAKLDIDDTLKVRLVTPNTTTWSHFTWRIESNGITTALLYEDETVSITGGSGVTPVNNNRNSTNSSGMTITSGVTAPAAQGTLISRKKWGGTGFKTTTGGGSSRDDEIILKQNATYLRIFASDSDDNFVSFKASWYEHTNKN